MLNLKWALIATVMITLSTTPFNAALADDDHDDGYDRWGKKEDSNRYLKPVDNPLYQQECGACHFAFQPGLLPTRSWKKVMAGLQDHFGEDASLEKPKQAKILQYLNSNAAEHSSAKRSIKIMRSLRGQAPLKITATPYIIRKHDELSGRLLSRKSIQSLSNCTACHMTAERGIYSERYIHIPRD